MSESAEAAAQRHHFRGSGDGRADRGSGAGAAPEIPEWRTRRVRLCRMRELTAAVVILFCAALLARGSGYLC